ncbi:MAG TPA: lamin tail domain-containing protein, partial [Verrucomicrobiae bacterium]|nr:lamin tail domain-containing protein [Verrucomicrobiae bacterium]
MRHAIVHYVRRIGELLSACGLFCLGVSSSSALAQVVINEIHYDPDVKTEPAEFIELYNAGTSAVDLSGWNFSDGIQYTFPNGTSIGPGAYAVVAQSPATVQGKFGAAALGPWIGNLDNDGERIVLRNASGGVEDEVDYQLGFPWPTVGDPPGYSIELVNPGFDNNLGGSWRASVAGNPVQQTQTLIAGGSTWKYFKGWSEASSPGSAWRQGNFDDSGWSSGAMPIGYDPSIPMGTFLGDMRSNYTTVFLRSKFVVNDPSAITSLILEALYDDGFKVWINGTNVLNPNMSADEVAFDGSAGTALEDGSYNTFVLNSPRSYLVSGTNVIAVQAANSSLGASSDFYFDSRLLSQTGPANRGPTPGAINSVYATNLPPQIRQVDHSPNEPGSAQPVLVTARVTDPDGVGDVTLQYQLVDPGSYIELTDPGFASDWTPVPMNDAGLDGDALSGDSVYSATMPASLQVHRRLVRYRIMVADTGGRTLTVPYADDPQPNFAYFVYDGVPAWSGAVRPGVTPVLNFDTNVMRRLPTLHLISRSDLVADATWFSRYGGDLYLWSGTLVYDGKVYDH